MSLTISKKNTKNYKKNNKTQNPKKTLKPMKNIKNEVYHNIIGLTGTLEDHCIWKGICTGITNIKIHKDLKKWALDGKLTNKIMKSYNGNQKTSIRIMHWNLGGRYWDKKLEDIQHLVDQYKPDYAFISEANYFHDTPENMTQVDGYDMILAKTITTLKYSRIVLLAGQNMQYTVESNRMEESISSIWIKTGGRGRKSLLIGGVYRDHYHIRQEMAINNTREPEQQNLRWKKFIRQWTSASNSGNCLVIGDTNVDVMKWEEPDQEMEEMTNQLKEEIITRNFHQIIQGLTRFWPGVRPSLIDQIWVNDISRISNISNVTRGTADHNVIGVTYRLKGDITKKHETIGRDRRKFSEDEFKRRVSLINWNDVFEEVNVNVATHIFETKLLEVLNELAPMQKYQPRNKRSDWISNETKSLMTRRDIMREQAVRTSQQEHWQDYRRLRNLCNRGVKNDRSQNLKNLYENLHKDKNVKGLFNLTKKKMGLKCMGSPEMFIKDGKQITSPKEMASIQMETFHEKVKKLILDLPNTTNDPLSLLKRAVSRWGSYNNVTELTLQPARRSDVIDILKELNGSHTFSHDGIDTKSLKIVAEAIAAPVTDIINKSISQKKFPNRWKFGRLVPLYKGGGKDKFNPLSFRPISLLASVSKIMEKFIQRQLVQHMDTQGLWHNSLHSYRKYLSSSTALAQITDTALTASEDRKIAVSIAVDESAAFDTVNHGILIEKLRIYKFHSNTLDWIEDYLSARTEYVVIGAQESEMRATTTGVPQGSILGPTLFNCYINDIPELVKDVDTCKNKAHVPNLELFGPNCTNCGNITAFADDAIYTTANKTRQENQTRLDEILARMKTYMDENKLSVNPTKTVLWEFMLRQKECKTNGQPPELVTQDTLGNVKIVKASKNAKCLGGDLQNSLQWQSMMETGKDAIIPNLRKKLGNLKYLANNIPRKCKILLINGMIQGKINYLLPLYGGTHEKYTKKIQAIMNNSIRWATGAGKRTKTRTLA